MVQNTIDRLLTATKTPRTDPGVAGEDVEGALAVTGHAGNLPLNIDHRVTPCHDNAQFSYFDRPLFVARRGQAMCPLNTSPARRRSLPAVKVVDPREHGDQPHAIGPTESAPTSHRAEVDPRVSALVSGMIDNIPYVATIRPIVSELGHEYAEPCPSRYAVVGPCPGRGLRRQPDRDESQRQRRHDRNRLPRRLSHLVLEIHPQGCAGYSHVRHTSVILA